MLDYRIDTFLAVCREMNYTKVANLLNITQPTVTQHIRWLEKQYHHKLFEYQDRKMVLTEAGKLLRDVSIAMEQEENLLYHQIQSLGEEERRLAFGITKSIYEGSMRQKIERLLIEQASDQSRFVVDNTGELLKLLNSSDLDFAIVEGNFDKNYYDYEVLREDRFIPVCAAGYQFQQPVSHMKDLLGETLIIREHGSGSREIFEHAAKSVNCPPERFSSTMEIGNIYAMKSLLLAGKGISFVYETAIEEELQRGSLIQIPLAESPIYHDFSMIWLKSAYFASYYREIADFLKN